MDLIDFLENNKKIESLYIDSLFYISYLEKIYSRTTYILKPEKRSFFQTAFPVYLYDEKSIKQGLYTKDKKELPKLILPFDTEKFLKKFFFFFDVSLDARVLESLLLLEKNFQNYHEILQYCKYTEAKKLDVKIFESFSQNIFSITHLFIQKKFDIFHSIQWSLQSIRFFINHFYKSLNEIITESYYGKLLKKTQQAFSSEERIFFLNLFCDMEIYFKQQKPLDVFITYKLKKFYV
jgi:hypothetical protein